MKSKEELLEYEKNMETKTCISANEILENFWRGLDFHEYHNLLSYLKYLKDTHELEQATPLLEIMEKELLPPFDEKEMPEDYTESDVWEAYEREKQKINIWKLSGEEYRKASDQIMEKLNEKYPVEELN